MNMTLPEVVRRKEAKWFVAEFLGTMILALTVGLLVVGTSYYASSYQALYLPFLVGSVVAVLVYVLGPVSGGHFNPAVSVGLWIVRKLRGYQLVIHLVAQFAGAYVGVTLVKYFIGLGPEIIFSRSGAALVAECVGTAILMMAVSSVVWGKTPAAISGVSIGMALIVGVTISLVPSGGILNPALSLAFGGMKLAYLVAPLLGGIIGAYLSYWLYPEDLDQPAALQ